MFGITKGAECCFNCEHFRQHYILDSLNPGYCTPTYLGHCTYPRIKNRHVNDTCEHFKKKEGCK